MLFVVTLVKLGIVYFEFAAILFNKEHKLGGH